VGVEAKEPVPAALAAFSQPGNPYRLKILSRRAAFIRPRFSLACPHAASRSPVLTDPPVKFLSGRTSKAPTGAIAMRPISIAMATRSSEIIFPNFMSSSGAALDISAPDVSPQRSQTPSSKYHSLRLEHRELLGKREQLFRAQQQ
jgi:hypothetical protein